MKYFKYYEIKNAKRIYFFDEYSLILLHHLSKSSAGMVGFLSR